jgi:hypothetical protein
MPDYRAPCKAKRAKNDSGPRKASSIRLVVIHSAEGSSAAGVANYFAGTAQASTQLAADDKECWRMLPDLVIPWGAPGAWTRMEWFAHEAMLRRSAYKAAKWCWLYGISPRWLSDKQLANGTARGLVTHVQVSKVFKKSSHWDPGDGFPKVVFLEWVKEYLAEIKAARDR